MRIHISSNICTIRIHFSDSESCDEIIHDIEVRMGELFQESMKGSSIISNKELDEVIQIMGSPEDFGAEAVKMITNLLKKAVRIILPGLKRKIVEKDYLEMAMIK